MRFLGCQRLERANWNAGPGKIALGVRDTEFTKMEDRGRKDRVRLAFKKTVNQVLQRANAAGGDNRHANGIRHGPGEGQVVALFRAIGVNAIEQNFSRA